MVEKRSVKKSTYILITILIVLILIAFYIPSPNKPVGGDKDEHGCLIAAGYSWNETDNLCIREFEKTYCSDFSRNIPICMQLYEPVCGLPIQKSYSNSCFACGNKEVISYLPGNCSF